MVGLHIGRIYRWESRGRAMLFPSTLVSPWLVKPFALVGSQRAREGEREEERKALKRKQSGGRCCSGLSHLSDFDVIRK